MDQDFFVLSTVPAKEEVVPSPKAYSLSDSRPLPLFMFREGFGSLEMLWISTVTVGLGHSSFSLILHLLLVPDCKNVDENNCLLVADSGHTKSTWLLPKWFKILWSILIAIIDCHFRRTEHHTL